MTLQRALLNLVISVGFLYVLKELIASSDSVQNESTVPIPSPSSSGNNIRKNSDQWLLDTTIYEAGTLMIDEDGNIRIADGIHTYSDTVVSHDRDDGEITLDGGNAFV